MQTDEIVKLTRKGIRDLLRQRHADDEGFDGPERRRRPRWSFPGTVELWQETADSRQQWFGVCHNLSEQGLGLSSDQAFELGTELEIAFHLPEASFFGRATIRHCTETPNGYLIGVGFDYDQ